MLIFLYVFCINYLYIFCIILHFGIHLLNCLTLKLTQSKISLLSKTPLSRASIVESM